MGVYILTIDNPSENRADIAFDAQIHRRVAGTYAEDNETWRMVGHRTLLINGDAITAICADEDLTNYQKEQAIIDLAAADPWCAQVMASDDAMEGLIALMGTPENYVGVEHPEWARDDETTLKWPITKRIRE